jgi:Barstar (barnase inhibitor)
MTEDHWLTCDELHDCDNISREDAMASLRWPEDSDRLDFDLMRESPVALYHAPDVLLEHVAWLRRHGYLVHEFDCSGWSSEEDFHVQVGRNPAFLGYSGRNVTAFNDRLCQIEVPEEGGTVLAFLAFDVFHRLSPEPARHVLDVVARWSRFYLLTGRRLLALVQSDDPALRLEPVGASPVPLNAVEKVREARQRINDAWRRRAQAGADRPS